MYNKSFDDNEEQVIEALGAALRTHATILGPRDVSEVVILFRRLGKNVEADALVNDYFHLRSSSADVEALTLYSNSSVRNDIKDEYLIRRLDEAVGQAKPDNRTLTQVIEPLCMSKNYELSDLKHLDSFTEDDFYEFFRNYSGEKLYWCGKTCLDFRGLKGTDGTYDSIGQKAEQALRRIGTESLLNRTRVMTWFKLELDAN